MLWSDIGVSHIKPCTCEGRSEVTILSNPLVNELNWTNGPGGPLQSYIPNSNQKRKSRVQPRLAWPTVEHRGDDN